MICVNTMMIIQTSLSFPVLGSFVAQSIIVQTQNANPATKSSKIGNKSSTFRTSI